MKKIVIIFFSLLLITGCEIKENRVINESSNNKGIITEENVIYYYDNVLIHDLIEKPIKILDNYNDYQEYIKYRNISINYKEDFFSENILLLIDMGHGSSKAYKITNVESSGLISIELPGKNCMVTDEISRRIAILEVNKKYKDLSFEIKETKKDCE